MKAIEATSGIKHIHLISQSYKTEFISHQKSTQVSYVFFRKKIPHKKATGDRLETNPRPWYFLSKMTSIVIVFYLNISFVNSERL